VDFFRGVSVCKGQGLCRDIGATKLQDSTGQSFTPLHGADLYIRLTFSLATSTVTSRSLFSLPLESCMSSQAYSKLPAFAHVQILLDTDNHVLTV